MLVNPDRMRNFNRDKILFVTHIPKCGGTSALSFFQEIFGDRLFSAWTEADHEAFIKAPELISERYDCIVSHRHYGDHVRLSRAVEYVSIVRDPIDRTISLYNYLRHRPDLPAYETEGILDFEGYVNFRFNLEGAPFMAEQCEFLSRTKLSVEAIASCKNNYMIVGDLSEIGRFFHVIAEVTKYSQLKSSILPHENISEKEFSRSSLTKNVEEFLYRRLEEDFRLVQYIQESR